MQWIVFVLAFQLGYLPGAGFVSYDPPSFVDGSGQLYQEAEIKAVLWKTVEVGGSMRVYDWKVYGQMNFLPSQLDSVFFVNIILPPWKLGWIHECDHPIVPYQAAYGMKPLWDGWRDEVYARIEIK
jgi:hypothetical protein